MSLFDTHIIVDWSARSTPSPAKPSKDAIWFGVARSGTVETHYLRTRRDAEARLAALLEEESSKGRRALVGFDFPFGYPTGVAERVAGSKDALTLWRWMAERLQDGADNSNNRYELAQTINRLYPGVGPFWGTPGARDIADVPARAKERSGAHPPEHRACELEARGAKSVWQLAGAGSVGSQVLTGLPTLHRLKSRLGSKVSIWPFETGWSEPGAAHVFAEIYPSLFAVPSDAGEGEIGDELQVRETALAYERFDAKGVLKDMFAGPPAMDAETREAVRREEAWILGLGHPALTASARPRSTRSRLLYERDPSAEQARALAAALEETRLDHLPGDLRGVAVSIVQSCGMPDVPNRLAWSADVGGAVKAALIAGAPILCDCRMVASGLNARLWSSGVSLVVSGEHLPGDAALPKDPRYFEFENWKQDLGGAIILIGERPSALFEVLERLDDGAARPAAILAFPVGFGGAAQAKAELAARPRGTPFLTLRGRRGGPSMACAALNALAGEIA